MDSLFGVEITGAVRFIVAFVVVLALIAVTAWLVRRFGSGALSSAGGRGRQPRLAVIDAASVDARRKLILVRRDNVEHLLMIGGPSDVVIEPNIVRASAASRDIAAPRNAAVPEAIPRTAPLEEETLWPLQPEPAPRPSRPQPAAPAVASQWGPSAPPLMDTTIRTPPGDTLAELADALATQSPARTASKRPPGPVAEPADGAASRPTPAPAAPQAANQATDPHLSKMAQELEAALRRPAGEPRFDLPGPERTPADPDIGPPTAADLASEPQAAHAPAIEPAIPEVKPVTADARPTESKKFYETLEQEMASLLGRPTGKT
jgi:flagellar biogenesis protein FliO